MVTKAEDERYARVLEKAIEYGALNSQLDETATLLYERKVRYNTLEKIEAALQEGIYGA